MFRHYTTVSETLHLNVEQSYDLLLEQSTATGSLNRMRESGWRQVSVTASRVYREENSLTPPFLHKS
ncbi:hypothetical protein I8748_22695 [Nostoc sp. CENA67]|uniref:Uncharacterized protein n=1 Tax=Amazonocrinis nigriterrae CENA67 TaxID=2794033 RepID=A0A8J7HSP3_9NOST|nr:hypothetical protein [Amazonocrinis nigriterrae]MBH8564957.1 hypothetical protein [Amazonocrinis nigriterrae CENA67]